MKKRKKKIYRNFSRDPSNTANRGNYTAYIFKKKHKHLIRFVHKKKKNENIKKRRGINKVRKVANTTLKLE